MTPVKNDKVKLNKYYNSTHVTTYRKSHQEDPQ